MSGGKDWKCWEAERHALTGRGALERGVWEGRGVEGDLLGAQRDATGQIEGDQQREQKELGG
jgi:hypothetical protein